MKINLQSIHFKASDHLKEFVNEKVGKLSHFDNSIISAEVTLLNGDGQTNNKVCEIKLVVPGNDDFVKKSADSYEEAVAEAVDTLQKIIRRKKDKV